MFPFLLKNQQAAVKYHGDRSKDSLVSFAMQHVRSTVTELWAGNFIFLICLIFKATLKFIF